ncbi:MAG TPA: hypothetical protein VFA93_00995 [Patescibacteria group bacterium]|nr:hypothetical protein [Patescibacteria group bacterium]
MKWLDENLKAEIRAVYEPRYKRKLTEAEIIAIANNLTKLFEDYLMFKWRQDYAKAG